MLSGTIKIKTNRYPITWIGEKAEHIALNHIENQHIYPFLHLKVQQHAVKGKLYYEGKRYLSVTQYVSNVFIVVLSLMSGHAVIHTAYLTNLQNFENKKRKSVSGPGNKKKIKPSEIYLAPEVIAAGEAAGVSESAAKKVLAKFLNGEKPLNKKK